MLNTRKLKKAELSPNELSEKAWEYYSNTDPIDLWVKEEWDWGLLEKTYYFWDRCYEPREIGGIEEVNQYFAENLLGKWK